ncbi:MAG: ribbon-helix-helix domain-containing protein [Acidobacteria bacterium]|nr:ribbon-helix-helix domain-containing protein [Acidobacteriota bacterium]
MATVTVRLQPDLQRQLDDVSRQLGITRSEIVDAAESLLRRSGRIRAISGRPAAPGASPRSAAPACRCAPGSRRPRGS